MDVTRIELRSFRNHERLAVDLAPGLNFLVGPVGSGKTSVVEALHLGCTGRSFRTSNEREMVRFGDGGGPGRARVSRRGRGASHRGRAAARRSEADQAGRCDAERAARRSVHPARMRVRSRSPGAGEGRSRNSPRASRRARDGSLARPAGDAGGVCESAGATQLAARPHSLRQRRAGRTGGLGPRAGRPTESS